MPRPDRSRSPIDKPSQEAELQGLRTELAACQQELNQYRELLPDMIPRQVPSAPDQTRMYTITLKARSEINVNCNIVKVASSLKPRKGYAPYVRSFIFNESPYRYGCAWLVVKFGAPLREHLPAMFRAITSFLADLQHLNDCHRICETINFIDEYDGEINGAPNERADGIVRRLPDKLQEE